MITNKITVELFLNDGTKITIDKTKMKSIQSLSQSTSDASTIFYGCLPSTGSIEIIDTNGTIKGYIEDGLIDTSNLKINICINDKIIRHHISTDSNYIEEDNSFQINLGDILDLWDEINFPGYYYPEHSETAYEMLSNILISYGYIQSDIDEMLSDYTSNNNLQLLSIKDYLQNINIEYPYLPSSTFREMIDKFCVLAQLNCYININGKPKFIDSRPISLFTNNTIIIPQKSMYNSFSKSVLLKNKYDAIETQSYNINVEEKSSNDIYSQSINIPENINYTVQSFDYRNASNDNGYMMSSVKIEAAYINSNFQIPKLQNYNLTKIITLSQYGTANSENFYPANISVSGNVPLYIGSFSDETKLKNDIKPYDNTSIFATNLYYDNVEFNEQASRYVSDVNNSIESWFSIGIDNFPKTQVNETTINIKDEGNYFSCNGTILISSINYMVGYDNYTYDGFDYLGPKYVEKYTATQIAVSFSGFVREIKFDIISNNSQNINEANNPINITTNELISNKTTINGVKIVDVIKNNILSDYSNGISNGNIEIAYTDYYYENGNSAISTENGDIITIGSIVKIEGDNNFWKVTGVNFEKQGFPKYSSLELIQCLILKAIFKQISIENYNYGFDLLTFNDGNYIISNGFYVLKSLDLLSWSNITPSEVVSNVIMQIKYEHNKLFLLRNNGAPIYSEDNGITWNQNCYIEDNFNMKDITFGKNVFVIVGSMNNNNHNMAYSNDGINWTTKQLAPTSNPYLTLDKIVFGNNIFVAISTSQSISEVLYSEDGINWNVSVLDNGNYYNLDSIAFGDDSFVISSESGIFYSKDGIEWQRVLEFDVSTLAITSGLSFTNNKFIFFYENYLYESTNGKLWDKKLISKNFKKPYRAYNNIYYDGNKYVYPINTRGAIGSFTIALNT